MGRKSSKPKCECKICNDIAVDGELYCKKCRKHILAGLESAGYFSDTEYSRMQLNEQRDRRQLSWRVISGSAEQGTDGDD